MHADFALFGQGHFSAKRSCQQLVAQAEADIRLGALCHPFADRLLLTLEPGVVAELPYIHCTAKDEHQVIALERWNGLAFPQSDRMRLDAVFDEIVEKAAGRVVIHMLEDECLLHKLPLTRTVSVHSGRADREAVRATAGGASAKLARTAGQARKWRQGARRWMEDVLPGMYRRLFAMSAHSDSSGIAKACRRYRRSGPGRKPVHWPGRCSYAPWPVERSQPPRQPPR